MRVLSAVAVLTCSAAALVAGCEHPSRTETAARDTTSMSNMAPAGSTAAASSTAAPAAAGAATAAPMRLADIAGKWRMRSVSAGGRDSMPNNYTMTATKDSTGWMLDFPNRKPVKAKVVATGGDSVVVESAPFESVRRKGVQVWTHTVMRRQGDSLIGTTTAHYRTKGADSVATYRTGGVRMK